MNNKYKPEMIDFNVDWYSIKGACMQTIGKEAGKEPSDEWKRKLLLAEHSPLRRSLISFKWDEIPSYVSTHFCRHHIGVTPYVQTSRQDRTGVPRNERKQTDTVSMQVDMNVQALINVMRKRLCTCSDPETIKYAKGLLELIKEYDENIAWACVPECIRDMGCPEFYSCNFIDSFVKDLTKEELIDVKERYNKYNEFRNKTRIRK